MNIKAGLQSAWQRVVPATKKDVQQVLMKLNELNDKLKALGDQLDKATTEIKTEIATLQASLTNTDLPADATASLTRLTTLAQALDDLNPDAPATAATPPQA